MKKLVKKITRQFRYGEKGFTLIELLVVVAILGILAAIAVPNVGSFMNKGKTEAGKTELHNVQTAVMAAMADTNTSNVAGAPLTFSSGGDADVNGAAADGSVAAFIVGGVASINGTYSIATDGSVTQTAYP